MADPRSNSVPAGFVHEASRAQVCELGKRQAPITITKAMPAKKCVPACLMQETKRVQVCELRKREAPTAIAKAMPIHKRACAAGDRSEAPPWLPVCGTLIWTYDGLFIVCCEDDTCDVFS